MKLLVVGWIRLGNLYDTPNAYVPTAELRKHDTRMDDSLQ